MKAKYTSRVRMEAHVNLGDVLPLEAPFVLIVDPANICNFSCRYCPSGDHKLIVKTGRNQVVLDYSLFQKIIDDLREFSGPIQTLRLYKEGEPLVNKKFPDMVKYAKASNRVKRIDTTTNGDLLTHSLSDKIIDAGLDRINISVVGVTEEQFMFYARKKVDFTKYVDNIRYLYENRGGCQVYVKAIKECLSEDDKKKFFDTFSGISDLIFLENLSPAWPDFTFDGMKMEFEAGNYGQEIYERQVCPNIFYTMVINSDGSVSLCVGDWARKLVVGHVNYESVHDIWNGHEMNMNRIKHLKMMRKENSFCATCQVMTHGTLEDIDSAAQRLLTLYESIEQMKQDRI